MLTAGLIVAYGYFMETVIAEYSGSQWEMYMMRNRMYGPYGDFYWALILCNIIIPQLLWFRYFRLHPIWLWIICQFINVGMWLERFVIVVMSLHRDFMPSSWGSYSATIWDAAIYVGTIGLFIVLFFAFIRGFPMISIHEIRTLLKIGKH